MNVRSRIARRHGGFGSAARRRFGAARAGVLGLATAALLSACGGVQVKPQDHVPPPLVDELPLRAGIYYSPEFKGYVHREERWSTKWEVQLGGAHVTKLDRLLHAMFPKLEDVADLAKPPQPPLDLILEPRFEEYSFVTPRDAGAEFYAVTIKYRMNLYDGQARLIDSLVYTGYGNTSASGLSSEKPLELATERAMRDAGAKFATEFGDQGTVRRLVAGEKIEPAAGSAASGVAAPGAVEEVAPTAAPPAVPPAPAATAPAATAPAATAPAATAPAPVPAAPASPTSASPAPPPEGVQEGAAAPAADGAAPSPPAAAPPSSAPPPPGV